MRPFDDVFASSASPPPSSSGPGATTAAASGARPKSRPSSLNSRSPSPGSRNRSNSGATPMGGPSGLTFFLTEENNFGVHSISESHLAASSTAASRASPPPARASTSPGLDAEIIEKPDDAEDQHGNSLRTADSSLNAQTTMFLESLKKCEKPPATHEPATNTTTSPGPATISAIPPHVFDHTTIRHHLHTPSVGSTISPTISTPSSPGHNLSSSVISEDSELELTAVQQQEEEDGVNVESTSSGLGGSFPQLVMPKVNMPRRKAFTETGRTIGKLKIMIVGDSGKTHCIPH